MYLFLCLHLLNISVRLFSILLFICRKTFKQVIFEWENLQRLYPHISGSTHKSKLDHKLTYQKHDQKKDNSQQRKRQIIWFNPPYSKIVTTKVEKCFLSLIDKHFPLHHKLHKLFNWNNVKISYSFLPNIKSVINAHSRNTLCLSTTIGRRTYNYINIPQCPLQQKCLSNNILYQGNIIPIGENSETKVYYGICKTTLN